MRPATLADPLVEDSFAEHWLWTVSAVTPPIMMFALATSAELSTDIAEPEPPWVLTLRLSKLRTPGMPTVASEPVKGPPPPGGSVTEGMGGELTVSPSMLKLSCSPIAPPASATTLLVAVEMLFAGLGSGSLAFTVAALEMVPLPPAVTLIDTPDLDGDQPVHHAEADRVFRWGEAILFLVTPEKYQMTELLPYYRLAQRYALPAVFVMNKLEEAAVLDDFADLACHGVTELAMYQVAALLFSANDHRIKDRGKSSL